MQNEFDFLREKEEFQQKESQSIDILSAPSIDARLADLKDSMRLFDYKLDVIYYLLNDSIGWLTTCMKGMRQDIARMQT